MKRYSGAGFAEVSSRKRWNGSAWVKLTVGKRWNGSGWVDLWGGSGASGGVLFADLKSTVSRPTVHYAAGYESLAGGVRLTFRSWLNSGAWLGAGIRLTVRARINGGAWTSAVIKQSNSEWYGTSGHSVSLTLDGGGSGSAIEFYVTRSGSTYGGCAGNLGSARVPKKYYIA